MSEMPPFAQTGNGIFLSLSFLYQAAFINSRISQKVIHLIFKKEISHILAKRQHCFLVSQFFHWKSCIVCYENVMLFDVHPSSTNPLNQGKFQNDVISSAYTTDCFGIVWHP